jgi:ribosomal protein S12 methylthiotransferase accessory factor YcaO
MLDGKKDFINTNEVIFNNKFVDSCGMASHFISKKVIESALKEFLERQCFILNYLTRSEGVRINIKNNQYISIIDKYIKNFVDDIYYFNLSIFKGINIVITLAFGEKKKAIGLGTSVALNKAILKSQNEILQNLAVDKSKYNSNGDNNDDSYKDMYHDNFYKMSVEEVKNCYNYLFNADTEVSVDSHIGSYEDNLDINKMIQNIYTEYGINPYVYFIPTKRSIPNLKVIKIIDKRWFPHMFPKLYNEEIYNNIERSINKHLDRNVLFIPFP